MFLSKNIEIPLEPQVSIDFINILKLLFNNIPCNEKLIYISA